MIKTVKPRTLFQNVLLLMVSLGLCIYGFQVQAKEKIQSLPKKNVEISKTRAFKLKNSDLKTDQIAGQSKIAVSETKKKSYLAGLGSSLSQNSEDLPLRLDDSQDAKSLDSEEANILLDLDSSTKNSGHKSLVQNTRILGSIGAILFFGIILLFWIFRKGVNGSLKSEMKNIKIISKKNLGGKKDLLVIRVAGESILLGVTDQNINLIKSLALLDDELPNYEEKSFSEEVEEHMAPIDEVDFPESIDGYAVSSLDDVREVVSQRYGA